MAPLAIVFGVLLVALGPTLYLLSDPDKQSLTALIPSYFGLALIVLGVIAFNEKFRKHAMHVAALVALVGCVIPAYRVITAMISRGGDTAFAASPAETGQIMMSGLCAIFLILCIRSFVNARAARKQNEASAGS